MIGLIAGLGPAATVHYYQGLLTEAARREMSLRLLINHADVGRVLDLAARNERRLLATYLGERAGELTAGGATVLAIGAVTPHLCSEELTRLLKAPLINLITVVQAEVRRRGFRRVVLLGTRTVMESRLFGQLPEALQVRGADRIQQAHDLYVSIVTRGLADARTSALLGSLAAELMISEEADGLVLAGTELALVPHAAWGGFPVIDCAAAHIEAILDAVQAICRARSRGTPRTWRR